MSKEFPGRRPSRAVPGDGRGIPEPSQQERRKIRQKYRELIDQTPLTVSEENSDQERSLDSLTSTLVEADAIFKTLPQMPREATLDSKLVNQLSTQGASIAQSLDTNVVTFHVTEFTEQLATFFSPAEKTISDWNKFGKNITCFFRRAPSLHFMYGSFETDAPDIPEKRKERRDIHKQNAVGEKHAPEKISEMGKSDKEATTAEVDRILLSLRYLCHKYKGPLCFFEFAVHPESFAQTVLNIFHISFLIRDEYAMVYLDNDGLPVIEAITDETGGPNSKAPKPVKNEVVLTMNRSQWGEIVREFKIEHAIIPPSRPLPGQVETSEGIGDSQAGPSGIRSPLAK